jgi:hypothetical protein
MKSSWMEANPDHSELDFMDSFDFSNGYDVDTINKDLFTETQLKNLHQLSTYLGKKRSTVARTPNDHYKSYLKSKRFGFVLIKAFKNKDFESVVKRLNDYKDTYDYILSKMDKHEQIEFKYDYFYQLEKLKSKQQFPKFKKVIDMQLLKINELCDKNRSHPKKSNTVELKDFFSDEIKTDTVNSIQDKFKGYNGKRLAMLLHRLIDLEWITILPKSKTHGRIHFVRLLLKNESCNLSYENTILSDANELKKHSTDDPDYKDIKAKLSEILKREVV